MRLLFSIVPLLLATSLPAAAQVAPRVAFPGGFAPGQVPCVKQADGSCLPVSAADPLPVSSASAPTRDANGDLRVPTVTVTPFFVALAANTSTELLPASPSRIGYDVQCAGTAAVALSRTHAALASASPAPGGADVVIPAGATPYFQPAYVSNAGVTAFTATAQACWGVSYARQ